MSVIALKPALVWVVRVGSEEAVLLLACKCPFHPWLSLLFEDIIVKNPGHRDESVNPVWSPLPLVTVAAEPSVARPHDLRIKTVHLRSHTVALPQKGLAKPAFGLYGAETELAVCERLNLVGLGMSA